MFMRSPCRSSCEERGLKSLCRRDLQESILSLLMRGAWIEITRRTALLTAILSLLMRGAWIEMCLLGELSALSRVAPHARSVA